MNEHTHREHAARVEPKDALRGFLADLANQPIGDGERRSVAEVERSFKEAAEALRAALRDPETVDALLRHSGLSRASKALLSSQDRSGGMKFARKRSALDIKEVVLAVAGAADDNYFEDSARDRLARSYQEDGGGIRAFFPGRRYSFDDVNAFVVIANLLQDVSTPAADNFRKKVDFLRGRQHWSQIQVPNRYVNLSFPLLKGLLTPYQFVGDGPRKAFEDDVLRRSGEKQMYELVNRFFSPNALKQYGIHGTKEGLEALAFYLQEQASILFYDLLYKPDKKANNNESQFFQDKQVSIFADTGMSVSLVVGKHENTDGPLFSSDERRELITDTIASNPAAIKNIIADFLSVIFETQNITEGSPQEARGVEGWQVQKDYAGNIIFSRLHEQSGTPPWVTDSRTYSPQDW